VSPSQNTVGKVRGNGREESRTGVRRGTLQRNVVYYESIKRELKIKPIYECRCDERLQTKTIEFTLLSYTGVHSLLFAAE